MSFSCSGSTKFDEPDESAVREMCEQKAADMEEFEDEFPVTEEAPQSIPLDELLDSIYSKQSQIFIYDLETVPDESRFPEPVRSDRPDASIQLEELTKKTAPDIAKELDGLSERQLIEMLQLESAKKSPRKTVIEDIKKAMSRLDADYEAWKRLALDPFRCRIVALSFAWLEGDIITLTARNLDEEMVILQVLSALFSKHVRCGFNIIGFDDRVSVIRMMLRKVHVGKPVRLKKYGNSERIDIVNLAFGKDMPDMSCKDLAEIMGITIPAGDIRGDMVFDLVKNQQWDIIHDYSGSDVYVERMQFLMLRQYIFSGD